MEFILNMWEAKKVKLDEYIIKIIEVQTYGTTNFLIDIFGVVMDIDFFSLQDPI